MTHPARTVPYAELRARLAAEQAAGRVFVRTEGPLEIWGYTAACTFEREWTPWSLLARGLVLDAQREVVLATPFPKFFNFGERAGPLPDEPFEVTEKIDGSLGIVFHDGAAWRVTTRGSLSSDQGKWATDWLHRNARTKALLPGTTYMCEIVYDSNRIVIRYPFEGLVLLAAYDPLGYELDRAALIDVAAGAGLRIAATHVHPSVDALLGVAKRLSSQEEGFVVRFAGGLRLKVKGDEYCRIHRLISMCTPLAVWETMAAGDDLEVLRKDLPEEFHGDFDRMRALLSASFKAFVEAVRLAHFMTREMDDSALGKAIQSGALDCAPSVARMLFPCRKHNLLAAVHIPGNRIRKRAFETFRPSGNVLAGYEPSTAINRFQDEVAG